MRREILKQLLTLATSGFGFVAALAWNQVIQETIDVYVKPLVGGGSTIVSKLIYAVIVTILAVSITYQLTKLVREKK